MSKLVFDNVGERYFETGVSHGVLFVQNSDGTYGNGVAWNGLTAVTESPSGAEATDLWADNIKYATLRSAENFGATIEAYTYPDEFAECDGSAAIAPGVYIGQQPRKSFGFSYRTKVGNDAQSDLGYKWHFVYGASAAPSEKAYTSVNDSPDAVTFSWEISTTPVNATGYSPTATFTLENLKLTDDNKAKLAQLEETVYGTDDKEPTLPSINELIAMFKPTDVEP